MARKCPRYKAKARFLTIAQEPGAPAIAIISYDEKPGARAIGTTAPDLPPAPSRHDRVARDHEYVRHGRPSLLAAIDLLTGVVHASVRSDIVRASSWAFRKSSTPPIRRQRRSNRSSTIIPRTCRRKPRLGSTREQRGVSPSCPRPSMVHGSISSRVSSQGSRDQRFVISASRPEGS